MTRNQKNAEDAKPSAARTSATVARPEAPARKARVAFHNAKGAVIGAQNTSDAMPSASAQLASRRAASGALSAGAWVIGGSYGFVIGRRAKHINDCRNLRFRKRDEAARPRTCARTEAAERSRRAERACSGLRRSVALQTVRWFSARAEWLYRAGRCPTSHGFSISCRYGRCSAATSSSHWWLPLPCGTRSRAGSSFRGAGHRRRRGTAGPLRALLARRSRARVHALRDVRETADGGLVQQELRKRAIERLRHDQIALASVNPFAKGK